MSLEGATLPHLPASAVVVFCSSTADEQPLWGLAAFDALAAEITATTQPGDR